MRRLPEGHVQSTLGAITPETIHLVEIKSARSVAPDATRSVTAIRRGLGMRANWGALVYDGTEAQRRSDFDVVPCAELRRWFTGS